MGFEYDPVKSDANRSKHGIDFEQAQSIWNDANMLELTARTGDEERLVAIGRIGTRHWTPSSPGEAIACG